MAPDQDSSSIRLHPVLKAASKGLLPAWARAHPTRIEHMARVSGLMGEWARTRKEDPVDIARWIAAGNLHDALRDEDHEALRGLVDRAFRDLPGKVLHGPAVAARLRADGVDDEELLHAVSFHTLGSAGFRWLGMALYAADFLEPGRNLREEWRAKLRERAARELEVVVKEILSARIGYLVEKGRPLHPETVGFWNRISEGQTWASASEY